MGLSILPVLRPFHFACVLIAQVDLFSICLYVFCFGSMSEVWLPQKQIPGKDLHVYCMCIYIIYHILKQTETTGLTLIWVICATISLL